MYLQGDWRKVYSCKAAVEADLGIVIPANFSQGWLFSKTDTLLLLPVGPASDSRVQVVCWNDPHACAKISFYLQLPTATL